MTELIERLIVHYPFIDTTWIYELTPDSHRLERHRGDDIKSYAHEGRKEVRKHIDITLKHDLESNIVYTRSRGTE